MEDEDHVSAGDIVTALLRVQAPIWFQQQVVLLHFSFFFFFPLLLFLSLLVALRRFRRFRLENQASEAPISKQSIEAVARVHTESGILRACLCQILSAKGSVLGRYGVDSALIGLYLAGTLAESMRFHKGIPTLFDSHP